MITAKVTRAHTLHLIILSGLVVLSSCARLGVPSSTPTPESPYEPPVEIPEAAVTFERPPPGVSPGISAGTAVGRARAEFPTETSAATSVVTAFGVFTDADYGSTTGDDISPAFVDVPAWIVTFRGLELLPIMKPAEPEEQQGTPVANTELNVVIDASTGDYMEAFTYR